MTETYERFISITNETDVLIKDFNDYQFIFHMFIETSRSKTPRERKKKEKSTGISKPSFSHYT